MIYAPALQAYRRQQKMAAFDSKRRLAMSAFGRGFYGGLKPAHVAAVNHPSVISSAYNSRVELFTAKSCGRNNDTDQLAG